VHTSEPLPVVVSTDEQDFAGATPNIASDKSFWQLPDVYYPKSFSLPPIQKAEISCRDSERPSKPIMRR
jgi:hypothetical protein